MMSCALLAASCEGQEITTIEGVSEHGSLAAIQKAYGDWGQELELPVMEGRRALVGRHDMLAEPQGLLDVARGRLAGLDVRIGHLGDDVGVRLLDHVQRIERLGLAGGGLGIIGQALAGPENGQDLGDIDALGDEE